MEQAASKKKIHASAHANSDVFLSKVSMNRPLQIHWISTTVLEGTQLLWLKNMNGANKSQMDFEVCKCFGRVKENMLH